MPVPFFRFVVFPPNNWHLELPVRHWSARFHRRERRHRDQRPPNV